MNKRHIIQPYLEMLKAIMECLILQGDKSALALLNVMRIQADHNEAFSRKFFGWVWKGEATTLAELTEPFEVQPHTQRFASAVERVAEAWVKADHQVRGALCSQEEAEVLGYESPQAARAQALEVILRAAQFNVRRSKKQYAEAHGLTQTQIAWVDSTCVDGSAEELDEGSGLGVVPA